MENNIFIAKKILTDEDLTFVAVCGCKIIKNKNRGVKPIIELVDKKKSLEGYAVADKVIGKAAALMYVLLNPDGIYAKVISKYALRIFEKFKVNIIYDSLVDHIVNRTNDGLCPMEAAVLCTDEPEEAFVLIKNKLNQLNKKGDV